MEAQVHDGGDPVPSFGQRCRELRTGFGYSLQDIADLFGYAKNTPSQWELADREPAYADLMRLAAFYGVTTDYLLGVSGAERDAPFVRVAKVAMAQFLRLREPSLLGTSAATRLAVVCRFLCDTLPEHYSRERVASWLRLSLPAFDRLVVNNSEATDTVIHRFKSLTGVPEEWFWAPDPRHYRTQIEAWSPVMDKAREAGLAPESVEELINQSLMKRARPPR